ncbi:MAG: phosphoribosylaminoimidazolesuccinocarboxamide synthase, partial [Sciscionella sp.]
LVLADEVLTPDSSRYWPVQGYQPGTVQPAYDKQFLREWLLSPSAGWDRASGAAPPRLPLDIVSATRERYLQAHQLLTGTELPAD